MRLSSVLGSVGWPSKAVPHVRNHHTTALECHHTRHQVQYVAEPGNTCLPPGSCELAGYSCFSPQGPRCIAKGICHGIPRELDSTNETSDYSQEGFLFVVSIG